ncbi:hypothetical protein AJ88_05050 [Mesorhizobium amorphae CCBAU 01583]|nr:hypothetical protein AJ88_05050 [Mesorhizobium amorphae CCBAU 01583]
MMDIGSMPVGPPSAPRGVFWSVKSGHNPVRITGCLYRKRGRNSNVGDGFSRDNFGGDFKRIPSIATIWPKRFSPPPGQSGQR